jgi:hypothetical protein
MDQALELSQKRLIATARLVEQFPGASSDFAEGVAHLFHADLCDIEGLYTESNLHTKAAVKSLESAVRVLPDNRVYLHYMVQAYFHLHAVAKQEAAPEESRAAFDAALAAAAHLVECDPTDHQYRVLWLNTRVRDLEERVERDPPGLVLAALALLERDAKVTLDAAPAVSGALLLRAQARELRVRAVMRAGKSEEFSIAADESEAAWREVAERFPRDPELLFNAGQWWRHRLPQERRDCALSLRYGRAAAEITGWTVPSALVELMDMQLACSDLSGARQTLELLGRLALPPQSAFHARMADVAKRLTERQ